VPNLAISTVHNGTKGLPHGLVTKYGSFNLIYSVVAALELVLLDEFQHLARPVNSGVENNAIVAET